MKKTKVNSEDLSKDYLLSLEHNDHRKAFLRYLNDNRHVKDKQDFLFSWIKPNSNDIIIECGSSSGKTAVDFTRKSDCYCLGIDFDPEAIVISEEMRDKYFPELKDRCRFKVDDLSTMQFDKKISKVIMADFSEHVPDEILKRILINIGCQLSEAKLYVYTPLRSHIFERMKHHDFILKNVSGHINVKTKKALLGILKETNWEVDSIQWRPSYLPIFRSIESLLGYIPLVGGLFRRKIAIVATSCKKKPGFPYE